MAREYFLTVWQRAFFYEYTFCCLLPENVLSLTPTSNSLTQKYIHFIQSTFISVDRQPFASKGFP